MSNDQRKQSKKDTKEFEEALIEKAGREELTFSEKQEYEMLRQRTRNRRVIINQAIIAVLVIGGITAAILFVKYGKPNLLSLSVDDQKITYYEVKGLSNRTSEELLKKVETHIERNNQINAYYNEALRQYNEENDIDETAIKRIEELKYFEGGTGLKDLDAIFEEIVSKRIHVLNDLVSGELSLYDVEKDTEEIERLNDAYMQSIVYILQKEKIKCRYVSGGIKIYQ